MPILLDSKKDCVVYTNMWVLQSVPEKYKLFYLFGKIHFFVGRNETLDVCIRYDMSVSRVHAIIEITSDGVMIQDCESMNGTFVKDGILNKRKLAENVPESIGDMDLIRFGSPMTIWQLKKQDLVTCTSTLSEEELIELQEEINKISGTIKSDWDEDCQYLTMLVVTPTLEVLHALTSGAHIVTPNFWVACTFAIRHRFALPDPKLHVPKTEEIVLNTQEVSFLADQRRCTLFCNKKILFFSTKQYRLYTDILRKAGGSPLALARTKMTMNMICQDDVIVIECIPNGSQNLGSTIQSVYMYMKKKNLRIIPEREIGLAIISCSLKDYCNPKVDPDFSMETHEETKDFGIGSDEWEIKSKDFMIEIEEYEI